MGLMGHMGLMGERQGCASDYKAKSADDLLRSVAFPCLLSMLSYWRSSSRPCFFIGVNLQLVSPELFVGHLTIWLNLSEGGFICGSFVFSFASLRGLSRRRLGGGGSIRGFSSQWHLSAVRVHLVLSDSLE
jgi:hypothetical protein